MFALAAEETVVDLDQALWQGLRAGERRYVIHGLKVLIPDVFVAPDELDGVEHPDGLGLLASGVSLVVETVSPGGESRKRDLVRKHRAYATAGIPGSTGVSGGRS